VPPEVLALIAVAAVLHATWNVMLKTSGDPLRTGNRAMVAGTLIGLPFAIAGWFVVGRPPIPPEVWLLGVVSGLVEVIYLVLLAGAYRRGDLSVVYPVARGTAPLLTVLSGVVLLGERLSSLGYVGVALLLAGLIVVQRPWRVLRRGGRLDAAVPWAFACGLSIATYSTIDRVGVRLIQPWVFAAILFPVCAIGLGLWVRFVDRVARTAPAPSWRRASVAGFFAVDTYILILAAYSIAPLSIVSPLRESAIVLVSLWGSFRLAEAVNRREGLLSAAGAVLIVAGGIVLALAPVPPPAVA
jgi:drug/metabolite transporter (DMT)-like permease